MPVFFPGLTNVHRTYVVSDDWQIYGSCQGVDFSKVAITSGEGIDAMGRAAVVAAAASAARPARIRSSTRPRHGPRSRIPC